MLPLMLVIGTVIELRSITNQKVTIQFALDSVVLSTANLSYPDMTEALADQLIRDQLVSRGLETNQLTISTQLEQSTNARSVTTEITYAYSPIFGILNGNQPIPIRVKSSALHATQNTEVVFIFDASGSMANYGRMTALKEAAQEAIDILLPDGNTADSGTEDAQVRLGMIAYANLVSAGPFFETMTGIPETRTYTDASASPSSYVLTDTCIGERFGDHAFNDTAPDLSATRTPDQAKMTNYSSNPEGFVNSSYARYRQSFWGSYWRVYYSQCGHLPDPVPLTSDKASLENHINLLSADGGTAGHQGLQWGWYMLSPHWAPVFGEAAEAATYDDAETSKFMILMTDGAFNSSFYSAYQGTSDTQARTLCDTIKDTTNIQIYAVGFQAPDAGLDVLSYCASTPQMYFEAETAEELSDVYVQIANDISAVRLTN